tara:strand:- start:1318 stop:1776 length:459 start_codon:yes stop_codon:yes gene_type:complete
MKTPLSKNFTLEEMTFSQTASNRGLSITPSTEVTSNLKFHCTEVLQPIRDLLKCPIVVTSGYRPEWLNTAIGGSKNSQHMTGHATDFQLLNSKYSLLEACELIEKSKIPYDQLIHEFGKWIHVSSARPPRLETMSAYVDPITTQVKYINEWR